MMILAVYVAALIYVTLALLIAGAQPKTYLGRLAALNFGAAGVALALAGLSSGIYFNHDGYFGDFWTATEALNKAQAGQLSSVDFFSPIGPVYYYFYAVLAQLDTALTASSIMHAGALAGLVAVILSVVILYRQISVLGLSLVIVSVATIAVSGRGNGELLHATSMHFLAPYNRWAWAFFVPVAVSLALPYRRNAVGNVALGVTIAMLLMLKVTYGAAALGLVVARVVLVGQAWRQVPFIAGGIVCLLAALELVTGQVTAHLNDLSLAASLPENGLRVRKLFVQLGEMLLFSFLGIVAYLACVQTPTDGPRRAKDIWEFCRPIVLILLVAGAGCAVLMQNHYIVEAAVYPLLILIGLEWTGVLRQLGSDPVMSQFRSRLLLTTATCVIAFYPVVDIGMHAGQRIQYKANGPDPELAGTPYADLRFKPSLVADDGTLLNSVADGHAGLLSGLDMLRAAGADQPGAGQTAALSFANPFPMLLGQPSPSGTPIWLHKDRSFSKEVFVEPGVFFDGVDFVMVASGASVLTEIYASTLKAQFDEKARSEHWTLLVRRAE